MKKTIRTLIIFSILLLLIPNALAFNPFYKILGLFVRFAPEIEAANVYPVKIRPGDVLLINVTAKDVYGISKVTANVEHESGYDLVELSRKKGNNYQGAWIGHNMKNMKWYDVDIEVINRYGISSFTKTKYQDPTKSHPAAEVTAGTFDAGDFTFQGNLTVDTDTLHVDSTGDKVGIGTDSPDGLLNIEEIAADAYQYLDEYSDNSGNEFSLSFRRSHQDSVGHTATINGERIGAITFLGDSGSAFTSAARIRAAQNGAASTLTPADIIFETSNGSTLNEGMRIDKDGNVGIGTTAPNEKLVVAGDVNVTGNVTAGSFYGAGAIPSGVIVMWSGSIASIPTGWALCNGSNGTPDLRERFIVGAGGDNPNVNGTGYSVADAGGEANHTLTIAEMPSHTHTVWEAWQANQNSAGTAKWYYDKPNTESTGSAGGDEPHENRPPYYALAYIMKL